MSYFGRITSILGVRKAERDVASGPAWTGGATAARTVSKPDTPAPNHPRFKSSATDQLGARVSDRMDDFRVRLRNAFTPSQPVLERHLFAGRTEVLTSLIGALEDQRLHVVVYGDRGIGKTSVLHVLAQAAKEARYIVVYVSCGAASNFDETFRAVAGDIPLLFHSGFAPTASEIEHGSTLADLLPPGQISPRIVADQFSKLVGTRVLVVLDEFDRCESDDFRRNIAELIKNLSDRSVRVQLVIAGVASDLHQLVAHIPSSRRNIFALQVPSMTQAEVGDLVQKGERASGVAFDSEAQGMIAMASHGSPYLATLLSHHAGLAAIEDGRTTVGKDDAGAAMDRALEEFRGRISRHTLNQIRQAAPEVRNFLGGVAGAALFAGGRFFPDDISRLYSSRGSAERSLALLSDLASRNLLLEEIDTPEGRGYRFTEDGVVVYLWLSFARSQWEERLRPQRVAKAAAES